MLNGIKLTPVISNAVNLTVRPKPRVKITSNPVNQVAYVNQTENFPIFDIAVAPIDNVKFTYQWYSNTTNSNADGRLIQGATKSSYQVMTKDVGSSAATKYFYVVVSGTINGVTLTPLNSSAVSLVIKAKPTVAIKTQPQNLIVHTNQNAAFPTFSVVAEPIESAAFTYQWYSNSSNSTTGGTAIKGATNANYQTSASDIGSSVGSIKYFYVQISGSVGGIKLNSVNSDVVSLTTQAASAITISTQPTA